MVENPKPKRIKNSERYKKSFQTENRTKLGQKKKLKQLKIQE